MKQKTIDASREARLWLTQVILPAGIFGIWAIHNTDVIKSVVSDCKELWSYIKNGNSKRV